MGSTNFNAPPLKLILTVISTVIALHVLTAMALSMIKTTVPVIKPPEINPPIEIQMIAAPTATPELKIKTEEKAPAKAPKPQTKTAAVSASKPKLKSQAVKKSQPAAAPKAPVKPTPVKAPVKSAPKTTTPKPKTPPVTSKAKNNEPFRHEVERQESMSTVRADVLAADNERKMLAAQAEKAAQDAQAKAVRNAQAAADAQAAAEAKAVQEAEAADDARNAKAAAEEAARAKASAASNTPENFVASNADWVSKPNFSFPNRAKRGARSGDTFDVVLVLKVNKQGGIDSVRLAQSSGNAALDREAQRQVRSGKFRPFTKNGVPVVGNVTVPISYAVP
jgi:colicin import membrane protein/protein TonB